MTLQSTLKGSRITLKRTKPGKNMAEKMFALVDKNREHLRPWFPWVDATKTVADTIDYLAAKEKEFKANKKIEYGIYIGPQYIGNIGIFGLNWTDHAGEIGYWIDADYQGKGYMTEAVQVLEKYFFEECKLNRIVIRCSKYNIASNQVAKKCEYFCEGRLRQVAYSHFLSSYYDVLVYAKLQEEYQLQTGSKRYQLLETWLEEKSKKYNLFGKNHFIRMTNVLKAVLHNNDRHIYVYDIETLSKADIKKLKGMGEKTTTLLYYLLEEDNIFLQEK